MKVIVLSDIHANITAFDAVLADAGEFDAVWSLGDIVGYGPDPNECVERIRQLPNLISLSGNHDQAVLNRIELADFNDEARFAVVWTSSVLKKENYAFLAAQPDLQSMIDYDFTLAHASPRHHTWEYILDTQTAKANFQYFITSYCLVGHTHLPILFRQLVINHVQMETPKSNQWIQLNGRVIINPGSVGQPRDHNPLASYIILDALERKIQFRRVAYDIASVQKRMFRVGLPERHILRLSNGF